MTANRPDPSRALREEVARYLEAYGATDEPYYGDEGAVIINGTTITRFYEDGAEVIAESIETSGFWEDLTSAG